VKGVILIDHLSLCIGARGELTEDDAQPIAALIYSTGALLGSTGEILYGPRSRPLQFHYTEAHIFALLRAQEPSPSGSHQPASDLSKSVGSAKSARSGGSRGMTNKNGH